MAKAERSRVVYKYPLEITDEQTVVLPTSAKLLTVQFQDLQLCLWAEVDLTDTEPPQPRLIRIHGTGHPIPDDLSVYVGTVQMVGGALVWHVYDGNIQWPEEEV